MSGPWSDELTQAEEAAEKSPEYEKAFEDLKTCYSDAGLTYDEDAERPGYPVGAKEYPDTVEGELVEVVPGEPPTVSQDRVPDTAITEDQIEMALKVADCQQSTDFTQHIADIYANAQAPVIKKYAAELTAGREKIDSLLAAANDDMATHPDAFSDPT